MTDKDTRFLYNKIINLEVITETILECLIDNEVIGRDEFEERIATNIEVLQKEIDKAKDMVEKSETDSDVKDQMEGMKGMYWGESGEA